MYTIIGSVAPIERQALWQSTSGSHHKGAPSLGMERSTISPLLRLSSLILVFHLVASTGFGVTTTQKRKHRRPAVQKQVAQKPAVQKPRSRMGRIPGPRATAIIAGGPWTQPTYADSTDGDNVDGEDLEIRRAAVDALDKFNGSVVVVDPSTGRILSMVNQKLALSSGFQPCSTVKVSVALAGLSEKVIQAGTKYRLGGMRMNLTYALAHSNNYYFATLGEKLGFERVSYYARLFGYGEKAGLNIAGEQPGHYPTAAPKNGGVGMITSFGEEIKQTPHQLSATMSHV